MGRCPRDGPILHKRDLDISSGPPPVIVELKPLLFQRFDPLISMFFMLTTLSFVDVVPVIVKFLFQ